LWRFGWGTRALCAAPFIAMYAMNGVFRGEGRKISTNLEEKQ